MSERGLRIVLLAVALPHLALGAYMIIDPGGFFDRIGQYGIRNDHYIGDLATVYLAFGAASALAIAKPSWRAPILLALALWYGAHAVNHLFDIDEAQSDGAGIRDTVLLGASAFVFALLAREADRLADEEPQGGGA
jgi:hypothetical protein